MKPKDIKEMEKQTKDDLFNEIMRILVEEHHNKKGFKEKWSMSERDNQWNEIKWKNIDDHSYLHLKNLNWLD